PRPHDRGYYNPALRALNQPRAFYLCPCRRRPYRRRRPDPYQLGRLDGLVLSASFPWAGPRGAASPQAWPACLLVLPALASGLCAGLYLAHASEREPPSPGHAYLFFAAARAGAPASLRPYCLCWPAALAGVR